MYILCKEGGDNGTSFYVQRETLQVLVGEQFGLHWAAQNYVESVIQLH